MNNEITGKYETGADFFHDISVGHGTEEALVLCGRYLETQMKLEQPDDEHQFCRELFAAMHEKAAERTDPAKLVYPYDFKKADDRIETSYFHDSRKANAACASAIDKAITDSCYKTNYYNLELAAMKVVHDFGFNRVNLVLAHNLQKGQHDGRYSQANKSWANDFALPDRAYSEAHLRSHPILIEDFTKYTRKSYEALGAERFALPGRSESGEVVQGYEIVRAISFDDDRGFAIGLNPNGAAEFVSWQFTEENGKRDYYWGTYTDDFQGAADNYAARVLVHMSGRDVKEVYNHLASAEMSKEQNYNMIDGLHNNEAAAKADLTDGQTHEELLELAPETLPDADVPAEKPSVLEQLREAREAPKTPAKQKTAREHIGPELEL